MKVLKVVDKIILKIEEFILSYAVIIIALMVVGKAIIRETFGYSLPFADEVSQIAVVIATFMGISYAARKGRHISMSAFYDLAPFKARKVLAIFIPFVTAIVLFVLSYYSWLYVMDVRESGRVTSALQMPAFYLYIFIPIGFLLGGIQFLRNMWVNIRNREDVYLGTDAKDYNDQDTTEELEGTHL
ncbi:TRAP transporter small permease [Halobacillus aidingensis]|uniref:TRAP-type C4-dicarboxylate transport system, small permease component n=1 Tax=Halobacillus aidingensis TaxID=240303 RepID=A0A1H0RU56_HALAD|nr:TRAP transporter small permease [Halobacillus aidingensis]SDP32930.1 TRAP-type C4-dicarboxylate transport system, small permease component [Halobacillus aidingensis]